MAAIVGIHGIAQQFAGGYQLTSVWYDALRDGLVAAGHRAAADALAVNDIRVAFFGDLFRPPGVMAAQDPPYSSSDACVITTPAGAQFVNADRLADLTGHPSATTTSGQRTPTSCRSRLMRSSSRPPRSTRSQVGERHQRHPRPGAAQRGARRWAADRRAPNPNSTLAKHPRSPAASRSCARTAFACVRPGHLPLPTPNLGEASRDLFPWKALESVVEGMREDER